MATASHDYGGGAVPPASHEGHGERGRQRRRPPRPGPGPDDRFRLTAQHGDDPLASGKTVDALTFDGTVPGPELRVREGDLVEVMLVNEDVERRRDDPLARRRRAERRGRRRGRDAGRRPARRALHVPLPRRPDRHVLVPQRTRSPRGGRARALRRVRRSSRASREPASSTGTSVAHTFDGIATLGGRDGIDIGERASRAPSSGSGSSTPTARRSASPSAGSPFRVRRHRRAPTSTRQGCSTTMPMLPLAAGGRYDVELTMPTTPVALRVDGTPATLVLSPDGGDAAPEDAAGRTSTRSPTGSRWRPVDLGRLRPPLHAHDRRKPGFFDGHPGISGRSTAGSIQTCRCCSSNAATW